MFSFHIRSKEAWTARYVIRHSRFIPIFIVIIVRLKFIQHRYDTMVFLSICDY